MRRPHRLRRAIRVGGATVILALLATSCGTADEVATTAPAVAEARFDGRFELIEARLDNIDEPSTAGTIFDFEASFGALAVETACGTMLGAFSLFADGTAGVTITGGAETNCSERERRQTEELRAALKRIDNWDDVADGFELSSGQGRDRLRLQP